MKHLMYLIHYLTPYVSLTLSHQNQQVSASLKIAIYVVV